MITSDENTLRVLNELIPFLRNAEKGFEAAADAVNQAELVELFAGYAVQRAKFVEELKHRVKTLRSEPVKGELAGGSLHRGWMDLRAASEANGTHAILAECERGEDAIVAAYIDALRQPDIDKQSLTMLQSQYEAVQAAHDRIRQLRDSPAYAYR